jgi:hypothetical protein
VLVRLSDRFDGFQQRGSVFGRGYLKGYRGLWVTNGIAAGTEELIGITGANQSQSNSGIDGIQ